jgi:hypothetical protein
MANTTSPSHSPLLLAGTPAQQLADISSIYPFIFPWTLCPPTLFTSIILINQLRSRSSAQLLSTGVIDPNHSLEANDLLSQIEAFQPETWPDTNEHHDEWLLIGIMYKSAIALYALLAFPSSGIVPDSSQFSTLTTKYADDLHKSLEEARAMPRLVNFLLWPLTVLGVEAAYRDEGRRCWIGKRLEGLARVLGTSGPLKSLRVLRRYWGGEGKGWDICFDEGYVFIM